MLAEDVAPLPPRPDDAASLNGLLKWASNAWWPTGVPEPAPGEPETSAPKAWWFGYWWGHQNVQAPPQFVWPPGPPDEDELADYMARLVAYFVELLAVADTLTRVEGGDDFPQDVSLPLNLYHAQLQSWDYLLVRTPGYGGHKPDSPDLWRWAASRRDTGRRGARSTGRTFPNALRTGQAVYDALAVCLPRAQPPEPLDFGPRPAPVVLR